MTLTAKSMYVEPTQLQTFEDCPRFWHLRYEERLRAKTPNPKLYTGAGWGVMMEAYYRGEDHIAALENFAEEEWRQINTLIVPTMEQEDEYRKAVDLLKLLGYDYPTWAKSNDPLYWVEVVAIEQPFEVPIPDTAYILAGRMDMVVRDAYGNLWVVDHKTTSGGFMTAREIKLNTQFQSYWWAAAHLWPDETVRGFIYNGVRKTNPKTARKEVFGRTAVVFHTTTNLEPITKKLQNLVNLIATEKEADYHRPQPGFHCNWKCPFTDVCIAMDDQSDYELLINEYFVVDDSGPNYLRG